jgi:hypothetical protein
MTKINGFGKVFYLCITPVLQVFDVLLSMF